jgi:hypothetical protein
MRDATKGDRPYDETKGRRRLAMEDTILAFRPQVREQFGVDRRPEPAQALAQLAAADLHRVLKLRLLIDALRRVEPAVYQGLDDPVREVLKQALPEGLAEETRGLLVQRAKEHLDRAVTLEGPPRLQWRHWEEWASKTRDLFRFSTHEETFQACNDQELVRKAKPDGELVQSQLIVAEFWSDQPPTAFTRYIDPETWPACSTFWVAMRELSTKATTPEGYDCEFEEVVDILGATLTVPLEVGFRVRSDGSRVWTRFNIARGPFAAMGSVPVDVDTGTVSAQSVTGGLAPTLVRATKYLHLTEDRLPLFPGLACDIGLSELMIEMAEGCREAGPSQAAEPSPARATADVPSVDAAVRRFVEQVAAECQQGIGDVQPRVQDLLGRFTGPSWDPRWVNDLLAMGEVTMRRYGRIASHLRGLANDLNGAADRRGRP